MATGLKILMLEDNDADAEMIQHQLKKSGVNYQFKLMMTKEAYEQALDEFKPDIILSDNKMPQFSASDALQILQQHSLHIPFILVTGTVSEEFAAGIIKAGADDYLLKDRLARLPVAIEAALKLKQTEKEKQQAELIIFKNEKRYRALIENNYDSITLLDESFKIIYRSPSGYRLTGWTDEEMQHADATKFIHPDDIAEAGINYMECLKCPGKPVKSLTRFLHKTNGYVWMEGTVTNMLQDENINAIVFNFRDVTERITHEEKITASEKQFRNTLDILLEGVTIIGFNWRFIYVNEAFAKHAKFLKEELVGYTIMEKFLGIESTEIYKLYQQCFAERISMHLENEFVFADKTIGWFDISIQPVPEGIVILTVDITERKKAEQQLAQNEKRFRALVENNDGIITLQDTNLKTIFRSSSAFRITGWTNDEFGQIDSKELIHPSDIKPLRQKMMEALSTPGKLLPVSLRVKHKNGQYVWLEGVLNNLINDAAIGGLVSNLRDVSERKTAEDLIAREKQLTDNIINNLPGIFYLYDAAGNFIKWNKNFETVTEYTGDEISKMCPVDFYHEDEKQRIRERIKTVFEKKSPGIEVEICTKNKNKIPYYINSVEMVYEGKQCLLGIGLDLSERKKAVDEIKSANERYEMIGKATNDGVWDWDIKSGKVWANEAHQHLYDLTIADSVPDNLEWIRRIHPDDRERVTKKFDEAMIAECKIFADEYRFLSGDTEYINVLSRIIIERDKAGKPSRLIGSMMDITENKKAEEAIKASEEKYRVLVEEASEGIFISDAAGRFITVNASACRISQYTETELLQMTIYDFFLDKEIKERPIQFEALKEGKTIISERVFKRKDGDPVYLEITSKLLTDGRLLSLVRDVAERKKAEEAIRLSNERYDLVAKATNDSIWELNIITGEITRMGDGFKTLFGYDKAAGIDNDSVFAQLVHPEDMLLAKDSMLRVFKDPGAFYWGEEFRFLKANGEYAHVYDKGYIIRDANGRAIRMIGSTQDITRLKENEIHLRKLNQSLEAQAKNLAYSNAELEQFAYVASHDLQEPLRMVTSFLSLVESRYGNIIDDTGKKYIRFAVDGAKRMRQIILDLLEMSRAGQSQGELEAIDLNKLVTEIAMLFQEQITVERAIIEVGELPVIYACKSSMEQVFQNLIGNAVKYKRKNVPVQITITATSLPEQWQFSVKDNGIGIEKEYFEKIFVIFQRLHSKNEFSGTGIGLAITKKIVENLGGKIWLESEPGKGSTFYFTIKK